MTFQTRKINPLDIDPNTGVGVGLEFQSKGVFQTTYTTQQAIKNNLINYLLTGPGERYLNPNFGLGLQKYLFEQLTSNTETSIEEDIQTAVREYFPSITIQNLTITQNPDTYQIYIQLTYVIGPVNLGVPDTLEITLG
jgi:phage baseplate assembly protein W